jgi:hypothetical protein
MAHVSVYACIRVCMYPCMHVPVLRIRHSYNMPVCMHVSMHINVYIMCVRVCMRVCESVVVCVSMPMYARMSMRIKYP